MHLEGVKVMPSKLGGGGGAEIEDAIEGTFHGMQVHRFKRN